MKNLLKNLLPIILVIFSTNFIDAQRVTGDVGIGFQAGSPSGLSIQFYRSSGPSFDLLAAWDLDDFFYLNGHALFQNHIGDSERLHFIYGPGIFVGLVDGQDEITDAVNLGITGTGGLSLVIDKFEIYARVTPRLALIDKTAVDFGGGVGFRYFF